MLSHKARSGARLLIGLLLAIIGKRRRNVTLLPAPE